MNDKKTSPLPLSVLIRTFNEADRLGRTLEAVCGLGSEIVVIDSGSTDGTVELAESAGCRVIHHIWEGFGPQRSFGEDQCINNWIFYIDADEVPTHRLLAEIRALFAKGEPTESAFEIRNTMVLPGNSRPCLFADVRKVTRLTDRRRARVTQDPSWDKITVTPGSTVGILNERQWHYSFRSWKHAISKISYTSSLAAETQKKKNIWLLRTRLVTELPVEFLKFYFVRGFVWAGFKGMCFAGIQSYARSVRIRKMLADAIKRRNSESDSNR
jgi:glycosyltransferase involved in cell wall biosynthesis